MWNLRWFRDTDWILRLQIEYLLEIAVSDDILDLINKWVGQIKVWLSILLIVDGPTGSNPIAKVSVSSHLSSGFVWFGVDLDLDFDWLEFGLGLDFGCPDRRNAFYDQFTFC